MSLQAYNDACLRAELFGHPKPDREEFLEKNKHLDIVEVREDYANNAESTAGLDSDLRAASGGLNELNSILGSTQSRLNRLKGVCGSLTNLLRVKLASRDNLSYSSSPGYVGQTDFDADSTRQPEKTEVGDIDLKTEKNNEAAVNMGVAEQAGSQAAKLEALIAKADRASCSMQHQNKQMSSFLR